jgi:hypothetical protein
MRQAGVNQRRFIVAYIFNIAVFNERQAGTRPSSCQVSIDRTLSRCGGILNVQSSAMEESGWVVGLTQERSNMRKPPVNRLLVQLQGAGTQFE